MAFFFVYWTKIGDVMHTLTAQNRVLYRLKWSVQMLSILTATYNLCISKVKMLCKISCNVLYVEI